MSDNHDDEEFFDDTEVSDQQELWEQDARERARDMQIEINRGNYGN